MKLRASWLIIKKMCTYLPSGLHSDGECHFTSLPSVSDCNYRPWYFLLQSTVLTGPFCEWTNLIHGAISNSPVLLMAKMNVDFSDKRRIMKYVFNKASPTVCFLVLVCQNDFRNSSCGRRRGAYFCGCAASLKTVGVSNEKPQSRCV